MSVMCVVFTYDCTTFFLARTPGCAVLWLHFSILIIILLVSGVSCLFCSFDSGKGRVALMGTGGAVLHLTSVDARTVVSVLQKVLKNEHVTSLQ